jgi:hypothetical protein
MENSRQLALKKWVEQLNDHRRNYFFEKLSSKKSHEAFSIKSIWGSFKSDFLFITRQLYSVAKQLKVFGPVIRRVSAVPLYVQCYRLLYLTIVVRNNAQEFRKRLLFKDDSWKNVNAYDYGQTHTQVRLAKRSYPDEVPVIEDKFIFYKHCKKYRINTPEVLGVYSRGKQKYPRNRSFDLPPEALFVKERMGGKGLHAKKFTFDQTVYKDSNQEEYTKNDLMRFIIGQSQKNDLIIQRSLVNHDSLKPFTTGALSTCRIVTVKNRYESDIIPLFAVLRMPCGIKDVDNYAQGGLLSTINLESGVLGRAVTNLPYKGRFEFDLHPDTNQKISGFRLPLWREMLEFTIASHKHFRSLAVGWDVCYSEKGIYLIEGNIRWGASLYECPEQKPFRETCYPAVYDALMSKYSGDE